MDTLTLRKSGVFSESVVDVLGLQAEHIGQSDVLTSQSLDRTLRLT